MATASALPTSPAPGRRTALPRFRINEKVDVPSEVVDLNSFCRWMCSKDPSRYGRFSYIRGTIWMELTVEEMYTHNRVKAEYYRALGNLVREQDNGILLPDGMLLRNTPADLSTEPDGIYQTYEALDTGRVRRVQGSSPGVFLLEGSPEMVLEIVSAASVEKDTVGLVETYRKAGVAEYWLVDARGATVQFDILKHGAKGYTATRRLTGGWLKSAVFGKSFQLIQEVDRLGDPCYILAVR
jgi:Uma2 family endonuclease